VMEEVEAAEAKRRKQCDELRQQADQLERESERNRIDKEHFAAQLKQAIEERSSVSTTVLAGSVASQYFTADQCLELLNQMCGLKRQLNDEQHVTK